MCPIRVEKRNDVFFRLVKCTTNRPPWQAATGGMRQGPRYQDSQRLHDQRPVSLGELIHEHVPRAIELTLEAELAEALGRAAVRAERRAPGLPQWAQDAHVGRTDRAASAARRRPREIVGLHPR